MLKSVCVLIKFPNENKYLAVARRGTTDQWGLPGGKVDVGEDLIGAAVRELKEETGFIVKRSNVRSIFSEVCGPGEDGKSFYSTTFEIKASALQRLWLTPSLDGVSSIYVSADALSNLINIKVTHQTLTDIYEGDAGPVKWITREELESGPFAEYNKAMFNAYDLSKLIK